MRLILDLQYVNTHVYKDKIKFEDWKYLEHHLEGKKGYLFKFDLKNDYHDIDIIEPHQKFLTFSWVFKGNIKIFRFYSFTVWTNQCIIYFHQGSQSLSQILEIQFCQNYLLFGWRNRYWIQLWRGTAQIEFVQETLTKSGFIPNFNKSTWEPCKVLIWLGTDINLPSGTLKINKSHIDDILNTISLILRKIFVSTRALAKLAGQLNSTKYVIGDVVQLSAGFLYKSIRTKFFMRQNV